MKLDLSKPTIQLAQVFFAILFFSALLSWRFIDDFLTNEFLQKYIHDAYYACKQDMKAAVDVVQKTDCTDLYARRDIKDMFWPLLFFSIWLLSRDYLNELNARGIDLSRPLLFLVVLCAIACGRVLAFLFGADFLKIELLPVFLWGFAFVVAGRLLWVDLDNRRAKSE